MRPPSLPLLIFLLLLATISAASSLSPTPSPTTSPIPHTPQSSSSQNPKQLKALESLHISTKDPCNNNNNRRPPPVAVMTCHSGFVTSISFTNCSSYLFLSSTVLKDLSTSLNSLSFQNCPHLSPPHHFPNSLHSFSAVSSFLNHRKSLTGVSLARLVNLTELTVSLIPISASGLSQSLKPISPETFLNLSI